MSLLAQPWPYAFWLARLDLALTGLPSPSPPPPLPSCKDSTSPLDTLCPRFIQAVLLGYVLRRKFALVGTIASKRMPYFFIEDGCSFELELREFIQG